LKKILYLTFNDAPSGIYFGQVIDVCRFWNETIKADVSLVAFISIRGFKENKLKIKKEFPNAIVLPMFPKTRNWKMNRFLLSKYIRKINPEVIVGRGPFATLLAQNFKTGRRICFDGRGAYHAEFSEYNVVPDKKVKEEIFEMERKSVMESDFRLAVSNELVNYWKKEFQYSGENHVVIPCTLNERIFAEKISEERRLTTRKKAGANAEDILLVYSGSSAEWQSFNFLDKSMHNLLDKQKNLKIILLAKQFSEPLKIQKDFPDRVKQMWVDPNEVSEILQSCDYGWLVRENSITNLVASPVKFSEYLSSGLKIIISEKLGDYSEFVRKNNCGILFSETTMQELNVVAPEEKTRMNTLAKQYFTKQANESNYRKLLSV
jgi:hypothetical protein